MSFSKLFQPKEVGLLHLKHRIVLAPLTRTRATKSHVPLLPLVPEYYSQRASTPGTLLISEATFIAAKAAGYAYVPGIWNEEQIAAWKEITTVVHAKGCFIYLQLWALGRAAVPSILASEDPSFPYVSASSIQLAGRPIAPRPMTIDEIHEYVELYATAASNAVHKAGFDGVEIHGANGYLIDQFLQDVTNRRTDKYGGSVENRATFPLEVVEAVVKAVGEEKTGVRLSPWSWFNDMLMRDPKPTFSYFVSQLRDRYPKLAYLHLIEPRVDGDTNTARDPNRRPARLGEPESNDFIREIWAPRPLITAGGYIRGTAIDVAEQKGDLIAFGRYFIANPDLPERLRQNLPLMHYDRKSFYGSGDPSGKGYTDYAFAGEVARTKETKL